MKDCNKCKKCLTKKIKRACKKYLKKRNEILFIDNKTKKIELMDRENFLDAIRAPKDFVFYYNL